jgi:hypothetical protein
LLRGSVINPYSAREDLHEEHARQLLLKKFLPARIAVFRQRYIDRLALAEEYCALARNDNGKALTRTLEKGSTKFTEAPGGSIQTPVVRSCSASDKMLHSS